MLLKLLLVSYASCRSFIPPEKSILVVRTLRVSTFEIMVLIALLSNEYLGRYISEHLLCASPNNGRRGLVALDK